MSGELDRERERIAEAGRDALADIRRASAEASAAVVRVIEQQTGITIGPPARPSVMDLTPEQFKEEAAKARYALAAVELIRRWHWGDARTLGELMPTLPEDVREQIADNFVKAGIN